MLKLNEATINKLLPRSLAHDDFVAALADAFEIQMRELYGEIKEKHNLQNIDGIEEKLLDYIAFERHVDFYEYDTSIKRKRELIKRAARHHRKKGTAWAVEDVVKVFYKNARVTEWWEFDGDPYHFNIEVTAAGAVGESGKNARDQIIKMVRAVKNERSWLEAFLLDIGEDTIELHDITYHYLFFFRYCNHVYGEAIMGKYAGGDLYAFDETYHYPVFFPVVEFNAVLYEFSEDATDETYHYPVFFCACGEIEPQHYFGQTTKNSSPCTDATYHYPVFFEEQTYGLLIYESSGELQSETYGYSVPLCRCGELEPIQSTFKEERYSLGIQEKTYYFPKKTAICGDFFAEE